MTAPTIDLESRKEAYPLENLFSIAKDPVGFISRLSSTPGDMTHFRMAGRDTYLLKHPDLIREVLGTGDFNYTKGSGLIRLKQILGDGLITSEGAFHMRQRRLSQPAFHRQRIAAYGRVMSHHARQARDRWHEGQVIDLEMETMRMTMAIVGKTLLNAEVEGEAHEIADAVDAMRERFTIAVLPFMSLVDKLPLPSNFRFAKAKKRLDDTIYRIIRERRASGADHGDLLSMLLLARDAEDNSGMTDLQLRDEAMTIFLAGYETITNTLTWTWYLLSQHPEIERKFHQELDEALEGRLPSMEDLSRLPYTQMVLTESMRLYPAAWMIARETMDDCEIGGHSIPAGSVLFMCPFTIHRMPVYFPEPEKFMPERWARGLKESIPRFAYFPFGGGPRQCIGEAYALMEAQLLMATIGQKWKLKMQAGRPVKIQANVTIRPQYGMKMLLERRKEAPALQAEEESRIPGQVQ
jgi:cytochrome P450